MELIIDLGRILIGLGIVLVVVGCVVMLTGGLGLGRMPGDIAVKGERWSFHFPIVTCIVLSVVLTVAMSLISRFWR